MSMGDLSRRLALPFVLLRMQGARMRADDLTRAVLLALSIILLPGVTFAQEIPDPSKVAPEYREFVQQRRVETHAVTNPGIDKITHYGHLKEISAAFRKDRTRFTANSRAIVVHVFYSGPVGFGFTLGRRISRMIHNPVVVYNYTSNTKPAYAWSIEQIPLSGRDRKCCARELHRAEGPISVSEARPPELRFGSCSTIGTPDCGSRTSPQVSPLALS